MNIWQKIMAGLKFTFGGFESAADYVIGIVNTWSNEHGYADRIARASAKLRRAYVWLCEHECYCPVKWRSDFERILSAIEIMIDISADGSIDSKELASAVTVWRTVYEKWQED